ncbi:CHC2 zinc finger domain-containing protein [Altererythrobacter sp. GH1-8]|uniref:DUF7146 domain-containing protein n=1 Tax=Altererythrobacter sp. GH1-8 TaxID=3349333 RepID=UPI00374D9540
MTFAQRVYRDERPQQFDFDRIRRDNPLPQVVGAVAKLRRAGGEWKCCCPLHPDRSPSFTIYKGGERFQCFGCGAQGDVLDFVRALHGVDMHEAARMLGAGDLPVVTIPSLPAKQEHDRTDEALAIWRAAQPIEGTLAEAYLRNRGITCDLPPSLRYAELPYGKSGPDYPCLIACVSSSQGPLQGIQRTFLAQDGRGKADMDNPKLSLGRVSGGAVRLGALDGGELLVCEGIEDGLSLLQILGRPVWAAAGSTMLPNMRFPPEVRSVAIGGDNDEAGRNCAHKAARAYSNQGLAVRAFFPAVAKDFNDELMEAAQ